MPLSAGTRRVEFADAVCRVSGADVTVAAFEGAVRVTDHARLAREYRRGRVLLAGDAAHLHSPMDGQGLKERRPAAERVLRNTLAQSALLRTNPHSEALRAVAAEFVELPDTKRHLAEMVAGTATRLPTRQSHPLAGTFAPAPALVAIGPDTVRPMRVQPDGLPSMMVRPDGYIESVS